MVDDIPQLEKERDEAAEAASTAERRLVEAEGRAGKRAFQIELELRKHAEKVVALNHRKRRQQHPNWDGDEREGGTVSKGPDGKPFCCVWDALLDESEAELMDEQPPGWKPLKRQGDGLLNPLPVPPGGPRPLTPVPS
jgi:hypothetical protein